MSEMWKQWAGRTVDGKFPLEVYLGGSDHSAVFLTTEASGSAGAGKAAIKLIAANSSGSDKQLAQWKGTRGLSHANLIRIFDAGRCLLDDTSLLYVVEEYAEENLSQILPERALTAEEAGGMLPPLLGALQFVHDKGLAHGRIRPSNIFAVGDEVKLASDTLVVPGQASRGASDAYDAPEAATGRISAAGDVWQLGMTLVEVMTQRLPAWDRAGSAAPQLPMAVPGPFRDIAMRCLRLNPDKRCTVTDIARQLEPGRSVSSVSQPALPEAQASAKKAVAIKAETPVFNPERSEPRKSSAKWPYVAGLAAIVAIAFFMVARPKTSNLTGAQPTAAQSTAAESSQTAPSSSQPEPQTTAQKPSSADSASTDSASTDSASGVVRRVMPEVSSSARRTIHGTIKLKIKVTVDSAGNVTQTKIDSGHVSKYFKRIALEAASGWKFVPAPAAESAIRQWSLQFGFSRARTEASAVRAR